VGRIADNDEDRIVGGREPTTFGKFRVSIASAAAVGAATEGFYDDDVTGRGDSLDRLLEYLIKRSETG
jgi:hypothetical protein